MTRTSRCSHGNALFTAFATYLLVDAVRSDLAAPVIAGFAVWQALLTAILSRRDRRVAVHARRPGIHVARGRDGAAVPRRGADRGVGRAKAAR